LREQGLQRLPDGEVFTMAAGDHRIVLTFDLDFGEIAALSKSRNAPVILMRLKDTRAAHVCDRLRAVLPACEEALKRPAVVIVEETRYRIRRLPIGSGGDPA
jgi:predicted nuclease of predicted toxin-antitoxin system